MIIDSLLALAVPIDSLRALPDNPRRGDVDAVAASLSRFGQRKPIVVRKDDGTIIAGNHTWQAAKQLGWTEIAVVWTEDDDDTMKAFALADNRTSELGTYDEFALKKMIDSVATADPELIAAAGYSRLDLAEILGYPLDEIPLIKDPDDVPPAPRVAFSQINQEWILGPHKLIVGDSTKAEVLSKALNNKLADAIFTDPPYNVAYQGGTAEELTLKNDALSAKDFHKFITDAYAAMFANAKPGCPIYVCHADTGGQSFRQALTETGWMLKQILIWVKNNFVLSRQDYNWQHEPIIYGWKPGAAHPWYGPFNDATVLDFEKNLAELSKNELLDLIKLARETSTVIREPRPRRNSEHPTMKPVKLITRVLSNSATRGNLILDPFAGSGSTLMAAHSLGMITGLVELDPKYADVVCRRWQEATGVMPIDGKTGEAHDFSKMVIDAEPTQA